MKEIFAATFMAFSLDALATPESYLLKNSYCGEIDPLVIGDACLIEVTNKNANFIVMMDFDDVEAVVGIDKLKNKAVTIETQALKTLNSREQNTVRPLNPRNLNVYKVSAKFVRFFDLKRMR
jgi:hypothetical protein